MGFAFGWGIGFTGGDVFAHSYFLDQAGRGGCRAAIDRRYEQIPDQYSRVDFDPRGQVRAKRPAGGGSDLPSWLKPDVQKQDRSGYIPRAPAARRVRREGVQASLRPGDRVRFWRYGIAGSNYLSGDRTMAFTKKHSVVHPLPAGEGWGEGERFTISIP